MNTSEQLINEVPGVFTWVKDIKSVFHHANQGFTSILGFKKPDLIVGVTDHDIPCDLSKFAPIFRDNDQQVVNSGRVMKFLEIQPVANNEWVTMLVTKSPKYDEHHSIIGTFGHAIDITDIFKNHTQLISVIRNRCDFDMNQESYSIGDIYSELSFSQREMECIFYLIRGKTARAIATQLDVSVRTIEHYLENIKLKMQCTNKSALIEKCINVGMLNCVPKNIFNTQSSIRID